MRGWISFGIDGLAAVRAARVYAGNVVLIFWDLTAWGWTWLIYGLLEVLAGAGILTGRSWAQVLG